MMKLPNVEHTCVYFTWPKSYLNMIQCISIVLKITDQ